MKKDAITVTGNTVIDALYLVIDKIKSNEALDSELAEILKNLDMM